MITLPGVAVSIILFLARRASLGNHSLFLFQRGNVEGTALGEKKISLLSFDLFACLENEEKKKKKPRNLEAFNIGIFRQPYRAPPKKNYSRNRQALATTASAYWNLKVTALKLYIYIALP